MKGFGLSFEELVVGGVGDHGGLSILFDAYLKEDRLRCRSRFLCGPAFPALVMIIDAAARNHRR